MSKPPALDTRNSTSVIIIGCGPTGAMLSAHLGLLNVANICLDKDLGITEDPRGIALDEDGIRALQSIGIYDKIHTEIGQCMGRFNFIGGVHNDLGRKPFMALDYGTSEGGTGHVGFICHKQPILEKHIRGVMDDLSTSSGESRSQLRPGCTVIDIWEDEDWVFARYIDADRIERVIRGQFLVGCDGKTGFTRKKYLEPKGIIMEQASTTPYSETWVAINWRMKLPTPESHPDFPLWNLGYSPEQVYDLFFPEEFRFLCNPERAAVCGRFGLPEDRLWRFEFVVKPDEDGEELSHQASLERIVYPYITHDGSRYGLSAPVAYPVDCIETIRSRPFHFSARSCNKWALGRVILCGDSAHVFPPFGGQGIVSGFRDALGLAWRLQIACLPDCKDYESLLKSWYTERKQQLELSLAATVANGQNVTEVNPLKIFVRNTYLWLIQLVPSWKRWLEQGARREGMLKYTFEPGMHFLPDLGGGKMMPQVYASPLSSPSPFITPSVTFTDDLIFNRTSAKPFHIVALAQTTSDISPLKQQLLFIDEPAKGVVTVANTIVLVARVPEHQREPEHQQGSEETQTPSHTKIPREHNSWQNCFRTATSSEFSSSSLCNGRPKPLYCNEYRLHDEFPGKNFLVVRWDFIVFAACQGVEELEEALRRIKGGLAL